MIELNALVSFVVASLLLCLAPGPDNLFVLTQSIVNGYRAGILFTLGICSGLIVHTLAVVFGLAMVFQTNPYAFHILKAIGAVYLAYLAWGAFRAPDAQLEDAKVGTAYWSFFTKGAIMNMTNPKVAIFFLAFLPQFVPGDSANVTMLLVFLGLVFIVTAGLVFSSIALLAGPASRFLKRASSQKLLNRLAGMVFLSMAIKLLFTEL